MKRSCICIVLITLALGIIFSVNLQAKVYPPPTGIVVIGGNPGCINISWNAHELESYEDETNGYYVQYDILRDGTHLAYTESLSYIDCGLTAGNDYCYQLRAELFYKNKWYYSEYSVNYCDYPGSADPPTPPFNFMVTTADSAAIRLTWDDSSIITQWYEIERNGNEIEADYDLKVYYDFPLSPGSYNCYRVRGCNNGGCSDFTNEACDTAGNPPQPPINIGDMPCKVPPFLSMLVPANVCLLLDNSGSMNEQAYYGEYNPAKRYYGYADHDKHYQNISNVYEPISSWIGIADPLNDRYNGNFLNWLTMRRIDIVRKTLCGGKALSRTGEGAKILVGEVTDVASSRAFHKYYEKNDYYLYGGYIYCNGIRLGKIHIRTGAVIEGIIQHLEERLDLGLAWFNYEEGGWIADFVGNPGENIVTHMENETPQTWTPLGEAYYEVTRYFAADQGYFTNRNYAAHDPIIYGCEKNFVILLTDGESTEDENVPTWLKNYDSYEPDSVPTYWESDGSEDLRDVALWARTNDLRPDWPDYDGYLLLYTIYGFGAQEDKATMLLKRAARNGGFDDINGNKIPDLREEYDVDQDGNPDTYFYAPDGYELEKALKKVFADILARLDAASAVSVVTNSIKGEGNAFQAVFSPKKFYGNTVLEWIGNVQALWIDQMGNFREDSDKDLYLDMQDDYIVDVIYDGHNTKVRRYYDYDGDGYRDEYKDVLPIENINFVWNAGDQLKERSPSGRTLKVIAPDSTVLKKYNFMDFSVTNDALLYKAMGLGTKARADSVINYIRGVDYDGFRSRTTPEGWVWKLGDIINSRPVFVGEPRDRFDLLYKDNSYVEYYIDNLDRQAVLYIGGNDGIMKAFNAGRYLQTNNMMSPGYLDGSGYDLGHELWGVIPFNLLPHLKWLKDPDYCHVYYVDLKLKAVDAKIFNEDDTHAGGWGTILIVGQNFGGSPCPTVSGDTLSSSYFALDVTNPLDPKLMWYFSHRNLGFTTVYPCIVKVDTLWMLAFGSGPTDLDGFSNQNANLFLVNLKTGTTMLEYQFSESNSTLGDPVSVDVELDYTTDLLYVGLSKYSGSSWSGSVYRMNFFGSTNPSDWQVSKLIDTGKPVQASGSITTDYMGNLWFFFGTGRYMDDQDERDINDQYFVGVKDPYWATGAGSVSFNSLFDVSDCDIYQTDTGFTVKGAGNNDLMFNEFAQNIQDASGWFVELEDGERVTTEPILLGEIIFFSTYTPNQDVCSYGGTGKLFGVYYLTGTPEPQIQTFGTEELVDETRLIEAMELGGGVPTSPTAHIGLTDQATISVQMSTGQIVQEKANISIQKDAAIFWKGR
ncbi:hypothetical protein JW877_02655 [bacterium]|nr:hypothetical protein [bacterium]